MPGASWRCSCQELPDRWWCTPTCAQSQKGDIGCGELDARIPPGCHTCNTAVCSYVRVQVYDWSVVGSATLPVATSRSVAHAQPLAYLVSHDPRKELCWTHPDSRDMFAVSIQCLLGRVRPVLLPLLGLLHRAQISQCLSSLCQMLLAPGSRTRSPKLQKPSDCLCHLLSSQSAWLEQDREGRSTAPAGCRSHDPCVSSLRASPRMTCFEVFPHANAGPCSYLPRYRTSMLAFSCTSGRQRCRTCMALFVRSMALANANGQLQCIGRASIVPRQAVATWCIANRIELGGTRSHVRFIATMRALRRICQVREIYASLRSFCMPACGCSALGRVQHQVHDDHCAQPEQSEAPSW